MQRSSYTIGDLILIFLIILFFSGFSYLLGVESSFKNTEKDCYTISPEYTTFNIKSASIYNGEKGEYILRVEEWEDNNYAE